MNTLHWAALVVAALPVLHFCVRIWLDGTLGGAGAGLLALPLSGLLAVIAARRAQRPSSPPAALGDAVLLGGATLYLVGVAMTALDRNAWHLAGLGLPAMAYGVLSRARGPQVAGRYLFPLAFTLFALPWERFLRELDAPLQIISARLGVFLLGLFGFELRWWNEYTFWDDSYYLIINETCSGMNMLMTLTMYGLVFGWVTLTSLPQRAALLLAVAPLALAANGVRVAVIWFMGHVGGDALAMGFWHTGSAYLIFLPVFWLLAVWARLLRRRLPAPALEMPRAGH